MANKNEREEMVKALCNLFGVNVKDINVDNFEDVTENKDGVKTHRTSISASINPNNPFEEEKENKDRKEFEDVKANLKKTLTESLEKLQTIAKEKGVDTKIEELSQTAQSKGLDLANAFGMFLQNIAEAINEKVEAQKNAVETKTEVEEDCEEDAEDNDLDSSEEGFECDGECEDCEYNTENDEEGEEEESPEEGSSVPFTASEIREKLLAKKNKKSDKELFTEFVKNVTDYAEGFVHFSIDNENYNQISEDLNGDEAGIYILMSLGEYLTMIDKAAESSNYHKDVDDDAIERIILQGTTQASEVREFDACDVEFLSDIPWGALENDDNEEELDLDVPVVKISLWF